MMRTWIAATTGAFALAACGAVASRSNPPLPPPADAGLRDFATTVVRDPGFESAGFKYWKQCGTVPAAIVANAARSGSHSAFEGTKAAPEVNGTSAICQ